MVKITLKTIMISAVIVFLLMLLPMGIMYTYDWIYGEKITNDVLTSIQNDKNPQTHKELAAAIIDWECTNFEPMWTRNNGNTTLKKLGVFNIDGNYRLFLRNGPATWILYNKMACCGEYANAFVYLMNKSGYESRIVHVPGEDHVWAEYFVDGEKYVVEPSHNNSQMNTTKRGAEGQWSYVESVDPNNLSDKVDVSDEYFGCGNLTVSIYNNENPVKDVNVVIKSGLLLNLDSRYTDPKEVTNKTTDENGSVNFKLGEKTYIVDVVDHYYLRDWVYSKNVTISVGNNSELRYNLDKDTRKPYPNYINFIKLFDVVGVGFMVLNWKKIKVLLN
ncbi:transglutaminase domain-containing protein [Methanococcus maripaludis]|uniref:Transglutaminase-like domain-containing protein n=1 Tax=Methanococcus maripaludis TaxID=39152 RepID=A0A7J9RZ96_METMI|nr:transglutaminase domain-containing protein [Methanococcus maripaludis]MBB6067521.1 hypothetical protein [Methanococcus maripaludis]